MCPAGNGKSTSGEEVNTNGDSHEERSDSDDASNRGTNEESNAPGGGDTGTGHDVSDDDTSDPIVVSPASTPPPAMPDEMDEFEDAKAGMGEPTKPASPSFVSAGLQRKASPLSMKSWSALALTLDGRDKITKVFQYVARFLGWWLAGKNKHHSARFTALYKSLSNSRKAFRLGRSFMEVEKLRSMGLGNLILWHLLNATSGERSEADLTTPRKRPPKTVARSASSNMGWGPMTFDDTESDSKRVVERHRPSLTRSLSNRAYRTICRPLVSRAASFLTESPNDSSKTELWKTIGSAIKMLGLLGFWAGDNVNFVCSTGALDDFSLPSKERLAKRNQLQTTASLRANQTYFGGSLVGLLLNASAYVSFRREQLAAAEEEVQGAANDSEEDQKLAMQGLKKIKEKQFSLFLAVLKNCCDVLVFSNNPGIDLHTKWRGKKNHEGLHCLGGLVSAGAVMYNNFPDSK